MDMRVRLQGLSPGVQDGEQANLSAEVPGIGCDFEQCPALASNNSAKSRRWFCHINGTNACGTLKTR